MSAFDDELRRYREIEKQLRPIREAERYTKLFPPDVNVAELFEGRKSIQPFLEAETERRALLDAFGLSSLTSAAAPIQAGASARLERDALSQKRVLDALKPPSAVAEFLKSQDEMSALRHKAFLPDNIRESYRFRADALQSYRLHDWASIQDSPALQSALYVQDILRQHDLFEKLKGAWLEPTTEDFQDLQDEPPESDIIVVQDISAELLRSLKKEPKGVFSLDDRTFEYLIAELLKEQGFDVEVTRATRDGGKDIIARMRRMGHEMVLYVECKHNTPSNKVGVGIVRQLFGVVQEARVSGGLIVTTSSFTDPAAELQKQYPILIGLKAYQDIEGWLRGT